MNPRSTVDLGSFCSHPNHHHHHRHPNSPPTTELKHHQVPLPSREGCGPVDVGEGETREGKQQWCVNRTTHDCHRGPFSFFFLFIDTSDFLSIQAHLNPRTKRQQGVLNDDTPATISSHSDDHNHDLKPIGCPSPLARDVGSST